MLCDKCKKNQANIHVSQIIGGVKHEQNLCAECAGLNSTMMMYFANMIGIAPQISMVAMPAGGMYADEPAKEMSETDFESLGLKLPELGEKIQQENKTDIKDLRARLDAAVAKQEFEEAAEIRDKIFLLEKEEIKEGNE